MFPAEDVIRRMLAPHEPRLVGVIQRGWKKIAEDPSRASYGYKRTVATLMHQHVMNELRLEYADGDKSARLLEDNETIRLLIDRQLIVRVKKMDERGYTRALQTLATIAFTTPGAMLPFDPDELPEGMTADVGYVLNDLGTRIVDILVAARNGDAVLWNYAIDRAAAAPPVFTVPTAPKAPSSPGSIIRVPEDGESKKKQTGE